MGPNPETRLLFANEGRKFPDFLQYFAKMDRGPPDDAPSQARILMDEQIFDSTHVLWLAWPRTY